MLEVTGAGLGRAGLSPGGLTAHGRLGEMGREQIWVRHHLVVWLWKVTDWLKSFLTYQQCDLGALSFPLWA